MCNLQVTFSYIVWTSILTLSNLSGSTGLGKRSVEDWEEGWEDQWKGEESWEEQKWDGEAKSQEQAGDSWLSSLGSVDSEAADATARFASVTLTDSSFLAVLDDTFTFASTAKQFVVNLIGALGGISFMTFMSYLPE